MHWLPLVAMVIASVLLFLQCPSVPRLVATLMDPGSNISTRSLVHPISNHSHSVHNLSAKHNRSDLRDNSASFTSVDLLSKIKGSKETASGESSQNPHVRESLSLQGVHMPRDSQATESPFPEEFAGADNNGLQDWSKNVVGEASTSKNQPTDRSTHERELQTVDKTRINIPMVPTEEGLDSLLQMDSELIMLNSQPRVLFSTSSTPPKHPPLQLMLESGFLPKGIEGEELTTDQESNVRTTTSDRESYQRLMLGLPVSSSSPSPPLRRKRRQLEHTGLERSMCESESNWVRNRRTAIDLFMQNVTVLEKFPSKRGMLVQYFYETRCRGPDHSGTKHAGEYGMGGGGCLGVDKRHWGSECQTKQSWVRAFIKDPNRGPGWRWIRIDSSCACVLYKIQNKGRGTR